MPGITRIVLRGFRGANKPFEVQVSGSIVISGPTGSGKTTLLQAVEWGLYGKVFGFTGPGFTSEDAYVNLFNPDDQASVKLELTLKDGAQISLERQRKKAAKSTVGKTLLKVSINGSSYSDTEAQAQIEKRIGLDHEKFAQAIFLHQETLRRFVEGSPEERSAIIDQLLGTAQLREFTEAIDPKRKIQGEIKALRTTKERLQGEQTMVEVDTQEQLDAQRNRLLAKGHKQSDLTLAYLTGRLHQLSEEMTKLAATYGASKPAALGKIYKADEIASAMQTAEETLRVLDRARSGRAAECQQEATRIGELLNQYKKALEELAKKPKPKQDLQQQIAALEAKQASLAKQQTQLRNQANALEPLVRESSRLARLIAQQEQALKDFIQKHGDLQQLKDTAAKNTEKIRLLTEQVKTADALTQLLASAHTFIQTTKPASCPVCEQTIDPQKLLAHLQAENKRRGHELQQKQDEINATQAENRRIDPLISKLEQLQTNLQPLEEEQQDKLKEIRRILGKDKATAEDAARLVSENRKAADELDGQIENVKDEAWRLRQETEGMQRLDDTLRQLERSLQKLLSVELIKQRLIDAAEKRLQELESKTRDLADTKPIDSCRTQLEYLKPILEYVQNCEGFEKRRQEKSLLVQHVEFIDKQIAELNDLEASLQTLRDALSEHQGTLTTRALAEFQKSIEGYYGQVLGHPYFQRLRIEPLTTEPVTYDIVAYDEQGSVETHINTRFSTAQTNATALAIFFAVNQELADNLPILILDDPTQNMDDAHQEALVQALAALAKNRQLLVASHDDRFTQRVLMQLKTGINRLAIRQWTTEGPKTA